MRNIAMQWLDEDLHWQGIIPASPEHAVPFATHVFIFTTREKLRGACRNNLAAAHSTTYEEPDRGGVGAMMFFSPEDIELSLAAHEATHVALLHHANVHHTRESARSWLSEHPESVAEMTGNLTTLVWAALYEQAVRSE